MAHNNTILDPHHGFMNVDSVAAETMKPFIIPIIGLIAGGIMMTIPKVATIGKLVLYFGAQSFMNIYMGWVLRTRVTVAKGFTLPNGMVLEEDLRGCPAGFALTAMQQVTSFVCSIVPYGSLYFTPYKITPKMINTSTEVLSICIFGCVFALSIVLNNFSMGYISIAVNLIIRSCSPLTTFLSQQELAMVGLYTFKPRKAIEIRLMVAGVFCAIAFTVAKIMSSDSRHNGFSNTVLGVMICLASVLCGSLYLALAGVLGEMKLSVYDMVAYMSVPATLFLLPFAVFLQKPVPGKWPEVLGTDTASDFQILMMVTYIAPETFQYLILSGMFSFAYNIIQVNIVCTFSPSATAFGGTFNKAALVLLTLILPFLQVHTLPGPPWIIVMWIAVVGNVAAFGFYSYLQIKAKEENEKEQQKPEEQKVVTSDDGGME